MKNKIRVAVVLPALVEKAPIFVARDIIHGIKAMDDMIQFSVYFFDKDIRLEIDAPCYNISIRDKPDFSGYDIVHTHMLRPDGFVWWNRRAIPCIKVSTIHCYFGPDLKYQYNWLISIVFSKVWTCFLRGFSRLVVLSDVMKKFYSKSFGEDKLVRIYNGRNIEQSTEAIIENDGGVRAVLELRKKYVVLGANAVLTERKGLDQIVEYLHHEDLGKRYAFVIVGEGKAFNDLMQLVLRYKLEDRVLMLGFKPNIADYLKLYDIYVMPSRSEGLPLALIEAAAAKKAIVCSDLAVFKEIFSPDEVCYFNLESIPSLRDAIHRCTEVAEIISESVYRRYLQNYTTNAMASEYLKLYRSLVSQRRQGS